MKTVFSMPYNGDMRLIDIVISDYADHVGSFYGSFGLDKFGGGRALTPQRCSSLEAIKDIVPRLERHGIEFNYVINTTNLLNRELLPEYQHQYIDFLRLLESVGIRTVTLCNLVFIELTRELMPHWKISASVNLKTRTPDEVSFLLALGCEEITLHYDILKDFNALARIRSMTNVDLKLIVNDVYVMGCPWQKGHTRMQGAHSRNKGFSTPYFSYYRNKCVNLRHYRPDEVFKAMWIPPDQLWRYEALGFNYFKLLDRLATTEWNIRALSAYIERRVEHMEGILGTYGARSSTAAPDDVAVSDPPYPNDKLEIIPSIHPGSLHYENAFTFFLQPHHPQECGSCTGCAHAADSSLVFAPKSRQKAIENNRQWQASITKLEFIRKLRDYNRRIRYE